MSKEKAIKYIKAAQTAIDEAPYLVLGGSSIPISAG